MWNQEDPLDAGRFLLHQGGWDNKSALERYNPVHDPDFGRVGGPYGGRGFPEAGFPRDNGYSRGGFPRDLLVEGDRFQMGPPPVLGMWPPGRRATLEEELALIRGPQRHVKVGYADGYDSYRDIDFREADSFHDANNLRDADKFHDIDTYQEVEKFREYGFDRTNRYANPERHDYDGEDYAPRRPAVKSSREGSWEREHTHSRYDDFDSDPDKEKRERSRRKAKKRDKERRRSKDRDDSPERGRRRERSRSHGHDHRSRRSRSSSRSHARDKRERSYDDDYYESHHDKKRSKDDKRTREQLTVAPSATVVVRWLSQNTVEEDLYQALAEWGPLRHVRVIKERNTGVSRGFAFVDFPSVDAARKMMEAVGENGLVLHGRRLFFEYSSKPTGGLGGPQALSTDLATGSATNSSKGTTAVLAVDWMCTVCGCVNFARRTSCFQCNEGRTDDAPPADISVANSSTGKKGSEAGPTHVLVVRGLDNNVNEEILHYEFSKYAPIKDLRLVRDKFTHISRGFAFVHFHSVEDATKALESSNGTTLEKNGQPLRVAYAKSIHGPPPSSNASSSLAAAAIEAATFAQQYDAAGWAPKEYNPDQVSTSEVNNEAGVGSAMDANGAPQAGFVWDEASGYYYDAVSGFYYDGHRGLYYDGNNRIWYSYNQVTQQYEPYVEQTVDASADMSNQKPNTKSSDGTTKINTGTTSRKAVISAPPATIHKEPELFEKKKSAAEAIKAAAAAAAQATTKKEKEKMKEKERELRLSFKNLLPSSKTKISGVSTMWKQKQHESQVTIMDQQSASSATASSFLDDKSKSIAAKAASGTANSGQMSSAAPVTTTKKIQGVIHTKQTLSRAVSEDAYLLDNKQKPIPANSNLLAATGTGMTPPMKKLEGIIRSKEISGNGQSAGNPFGGDYHPAGNSLKPRQSSKNSTNVGAFDAGDSKVIDRGSNVDVPSRMSSNSLNASITPFRTDASALGSYGPQAGGRRRFTEAPQPGYRDRAAERRNLHGASLPGDV